MSGWLTDPETRQPLPALAGDAPPRPRGRASHWAIERDENGMPVRMRFIFCDDPKCCPPLPVPA